MSMPVVPTSVDLSNVKPTMDSGVSLGYTRHTAYGSTHTPGSTVIIDIPTGGAPHSLFPSESYLSLTFTPTYTITTGAMYLDGSAHSLIERIRVSNGSDLYTISNGYGVLANYLIDMTMSASDKDGAQMSLGTSSTQPGIALTTATPVTFNLNLFAPIVGQLSEQAVPLSWLPSANLRIEIDLAPAARVMTTCSSNTANGTAALGIANGLDYTVSAVAYYAKNCMLSASINDALLAAHDGMPISIPAVGFHYESAQLPANSTGLNAKVNMVHKSLKSVNWWMQTNATHNGTIVGDRIGRGSSSRYLGALNNWYLDANGMQLPSFSISGRARVFSELLRVFDKTANPAGIAFTADLFQTTASTHANQLALGGKAVAAIDLESTDNGDQVFTGLDTSGGQISVVAAFDSAIAESSIVHVVGSYDIIYTLEDGALVRRSN